ncbi:MAG: VirB8/TrbF family protein [Rickettsiaceae bacterium]|nr:VirB8/TrbF family protein [Rickettsiaceae bacterium]
MKDLIESGEYFKNARLWYHEIYLMPFSIQYIFCALVSLLALLLFLIAICINNLLPLQKEVMYVIKIPEGLNLNVDISKSFTTGGDEENYKVIAKSFITMFLKAYEGYNYNKLQEDARFVKNTSDKIIFNKYYDSLSLSNPNSPLIKYQKAIKSVQIDSLQIISPKKAAVSFTTKAIKENGALFETLKSSAEIDFEMDTIPPKEQKNGFYFAVVGYQRGDYETVNDKN